MILGMICHLYAICARCIYRFDKPQGDIAVSDRTEYRWRMQWRPVDELVLCLFWIGMV